MKLSHKLIMVSAAALMSVSPLLNTNSVSAATATKKTTVSKKNASTSSKKTSTASTKKATTKKASASSSKKTTTKKTSSNTLNIIHNAYVYDENGKRLDKYMGSAKWTLIAKGTPNIVSNGTKTIDGVLYYSLGNNAYIKAANVASNTSTTSKKSTTSKASSAKSSSSKSVNIEITHNAYIYDKNGKRIENYEGQSKLKKGTDTEAFGTKTIKGKKYYQLDEKGTAFVKSGNVSETTTITMKKNAYIYNSQGDTKKKKVKKGQTVKTTEARYFGTKLYYKIGEDQFVKAANVGKVSGPELDPVNEPNGAATVVDDTSVDPNVTKVTTIRVAPLYNIKGQKDDTRAFGAGQRQQVSELRYIATSTTDTPALFYKLASGRGYLKATDVTVSGKVLTAVNTPEQAKEDVTVATATDKTQLAQNINDAANVKNSDAYKLSSSTLRSAYDKAVSDGTAINANTSATVAQVKEANTAIVEAKAKLNGKKVAVANPNSLTQEEVTAIVKLVSDVNNVSESSVQFSNNNTTLAIVTNGYTQTLNLNDYITQSTTSNN